MKRLLANMFNPYLAQRHLVLDGEPVELRMTLGALAALEAALEEDCLVSMLKRFSGNAFSSRDLILVLNAGLYGAGRNFSIEDRVIEGGATEAAKVARGLLLSAFPEVENASAI